MLLRAGSCSKVGSGKSAFSRAFIRSAFEDDTLSVPSPTYLLQQVYEGVSGNGKPSCSCDRSLVTSQPYFDKLQAELLSKGIRQQGPEITEDVEMSAYEDRHWRMICLHPFGQAWLNRVEAIAHAMALHGSAAGLYNAPE
ncbi:hypothetical protein ABBQ32_008945 [Trebouxia sp. C0010 RCD-2024]